MPRTMAVVASALVMSLGALYAADVGGRGLGGTAVRSTPRPAYFDSPEYELSLLHVAGNRNGSGRVFLI